MTLPKEVADSLAEIAGEAECRCDVAYTSRGLKDPTCNHDLKDSVEVIRAHLLSQDAENTKLAGLHKSATRYAQRQQSRADKAESRLTAVLSEPIP